MAPHIAEGSSERGPGLHRCHVIRGKGGGEGGGGGGVGWGRGYLKLTTEMPAITAAVAAPAVTMTPHVASSEPKALLRRPPRRRLAGGLLDPTGLGWPMEAAWFSRTTCLGGLCLGGTARLRVDNTLAVSSDLHRAVLVRLLPK